MKIWGLEFLGDQVWNQGRIFFSYNIRNQFDWLPLFICFKLLSHCCVLICWDVVLLWVMWVYRGQNVENSQCPVLSWCFYASYVFCFFFFVSLAVVVLYLLFCKEQIHKIDSRNLNTQKQHGALQTNYYTTSASVHTGRSQKCLALHFCWVFESTHICNLLIFTLQIIGTKMFLQALIPVLIIVSVGQLKPCQWKMTGKW